MLETGEMWGLGARSNSPKWDPGAEPWKFFEIFTSPDPWKSLICSLETLSFESLSSLKPVKPVNFKF